MGFDSMVNRIPQKVSGRAGNAYSTYTPQDNVYQWALGGYPLISASSQDRQDVETLVEQRKNQFDNYKDPGEYSLTQWWLRSQHQFNGGAGITYQDPDTQNTYLLAKNTRYDTSLGVDPFTDYSKVTLLPEINQSATFTTSSDAGGFNFNSFIQSFVSSTGADSVFAARGHTVYNLAIGASDFTVTGSTVLGNDASQYGITGGIGYTGSGIAGGNTAYVYQDQATVTANNGVFSVTEAGVATRIYVGDGLHNTKTITVAKTDLLLGSGNLLYQLNAGAAANTALPAAAAAIPIGQQIASITSGPDAVYVAANDGAMGYIYKTQYSTTTPGVIVGLSQVAVLPEGEQVNTISFYVGTYMVLATDKGGRVANVTDAGVLYGPLVFTFPKIVGATNGCKGITFFGSLAFLGVYSSTPQHDGAWGTMCIDLGTVNADSVTGFTTNAYARWIFSSSMTQPLNDLTMSQSGRLVAAALPPGGAVNSSLWLQHASNLTPTGYLTTGRCRFNTVEPKLFKFFSVRTPVPFAGSLSVSLLDEGGGETFYITYTTAVTTGTNDVATPTPSGPQNWIKLKFRFTRDAVTSNGPTMNGWQIKALPGITRQRIFSKWFQCFNNIQDMNGSRIGSDAYALTTLNAVRLMAQRQDTVILQDLQYGLNELVVVDQYQFIQDAPPGPDQENYGGYLRIDLRTVADVVPPLPPVTGTPVD